MEGGGWYVGWRVRGAGCDLQIHADAACHTLLQAFLVQMALALWRRAEGRNPVPQEPVGPKKLRDM